MAEAANGPTTPEADAILDERGIFRHPRHPGQRRRRDRQLLRVGAGPATATIWTEGVVNDKLKVIMVKAFHEVLRLAQTNEVNNRVGAYLLAVDRVASATALRGLYP